MKKLKKYSIGIDSVVDAISLVENPAIESNFIFLSEQKPLFLESDEKHMVYGAVLRPDYPIYRRYGEDEFYVQFSNECIEQLSRNFLKDGFQSNWTTDHKDIVNGLTVVESWIKVDSEKDKSIALGLDPSLEVGSWIVGCHVQDDDTWNRIKQGQLCGFSIEAFVNLEEINLNKIEEDKMNENFQTVEVNDSFWDKIKGIITDALKSPSTPQTEAETTAEVVVADMIEETNVETPVEEPVVDTPMEEETVVEETPTEPEAIAEEVVEEVVEEAPNEAVAEQNLQDVINELNAKIDELNVQIEELKKENVKLSKQPSTQPINTHMAAQSQSNFDRMIAIMNGSAFQK